MNAVSFTYPIEISLTLLRIPAGSSQPVNYFKKRGGVGEITTDKSLSEVSSQNPLAKFRLNNANGVILGKAANSLLKHSQNSRKIIYHDDFCECAFEFR